MRRLIQLRTKLMLVAVLGLVVYLTVMVLSDHSAVAMVRWCSTCHPG